VAAALRLERACRVGLPCCPFACVSSALCPSPVPPAPNILLACHPVGSCRTPPRLRHSFPCTQRLVNRLGLAERRVSELHAAHRDLRNTITVLRRERNTISKQLRTTDRRAASLAHDLKHIAHVAAESVETTTKLEAKLERSFAEFKWEADYHGKILGQFDDTIGSLDAKIVAGIEDADSALEADRRAQWARLHRWRREDDQTAGRFGFMHSTSAYLEDKVATLCRLVGIKFEGMLSVSVGSTKALARKPRPE